MTVPRRWLILYQYASGLCDASTGLLLSAAPAWTLGLMGLTIIPQPIGFIRYIGVFVLSIGLTYLWAAIGWPLTERTHIAWSTQWKITALIRTLVAVFVVCQVASSAMEVRWMSVALTDAAFALVQWTGIAKGWLARAS